MILKKINFSNMLWFLVIIVVVFVDQYSKHLAIKHISDYELYLLPILNFSYATNSGAAFNFLANAGGWQSYVFSGFAVIVSIITLGWILCLDRSRKWSAFALSLVCAGALGNLIDRLQLGYVIDFIDFHWRDYHFATFNIADAAITVGVTLLFLEAVFGKSTHQDEFSSFY